MKENTTNIIQQVRMGMVKKKTTMKDDETENEDEESDEAL